MAYYIKIESLGPAWELEELPWWKCPDLMDDPRFVASESNGCLDYEAVLPKAAVRDLHQRYKPLVHDDPIVPRWQQMAADLDTVLANDSPHDFFRVRVLEWSSGM